MAIKLIEKNLGAQTTYQTDPDIDLGFVTTRTLLTNQSTDRGMYVSFDGVEDHVYVKPGSIPVEVWQRVTKFWLRSSAAAGTTPILAVMAEQF